MKKLTPIRIGMRGLSEFSMLILSTRAQSQLRLKHNGSISFGFDGSGEMFLSRLGGQPKGSTALGS